MAVLFGQPSLAAPTSHPSSVTNSTGCLARLELAGGELLRLGFAPTTDKDTERWLRVGRDEEGTFFLSLQMRTSADGSQTGFNLAVYPTSAKIPASWRFRKHRLCCNDHTDWEDNIIEFEWVRQGQGKAAMITVWEFGGLSPRDAITVRRDRETFTRVARHAADDCLATKE